MKIWGKRIRRNFGGDQEMVDRTFLEWWGIYGDIVKTAAKALLIALVVIALISAFIYALILISGSASSSFLSSKGSKVCYSYFECADFNMDLCLASEKYTRQECVDLVGGSNR